jgi:hypothetical protein
MSVRSRVRARLREAIRKRHDAKPGGDRRHKLARLVRRLKARLEELLRGPDFNGHPTNVSADVKRVIVRANRAGLYVTSTTDGGHASTSYHYSGRAVDVAAPMTSAGIALMVKFQRELASSPGSYLEVFGPDNSACVKNGTRISLAEGTALENQHDNHVHVAL